MGKSMFARASAGLNLTPGERAALKAVQGIIVSALVAGAVAVLPYLTGATVDWATVLHVFAAAVVASLALAVNKYWTAQGDPPLAVVPPDAPAAPQPPAPQAGA